MALIRDLWLFTKALGSNWFALVTGGIVSFGMAVTEHLSDKNLPHGTYGAILALTFFTAAFLSWRKERLRSREAIQRIKAEESSKSRTLLAEVGRDRDEWKAKTHAVSLDLESARAVIASRHKRTSVEILGMTEEQQNCFGIRIKSHDSRTKSFGAKLIAIAPNPPATTPVPLPISLQIASQPGKASTLVPPGQTIGINVFKMFHPDEGLFGFLSSSDTREIHIAKQNYVLTIAAYCENGDSAEMTFSVEPRMIRALFQPVSQ